MVLGMVLDWHFGDKEDARQRIIGHFMKPNGKGEPCVARYL